MESLQFKTSIRPATNNKHKVHYLDYVISGKFLGDSLNIKKLDKVSPFGDTVHKNYQIQLLDALTLNKKSELKSGRTVLYVCPECGDIECGAVTISIEENADNIIWKEFGLESNLDGIMEEFQQLELIEFEKKSYLKAFQELKENL